MCCRCLADVVTVNLGVLYDRYKLWADECSKMFGGLDLCSVEVIQTAGGQEYIIEVSYICIPVKYT